MNNQTLKLNSGYEMPVVGLGTWKAPADKAGEAVEYALMEAGYKHIDCAPIYLNEPEIGRAFNKVFASGKVKREDVFITSKLWNTMHAHDDVITACKQTLKDLQLEYLDLYLMHWGIAQPKDMGNEPVDADGFTKLTNVSVRETWEAMEELVKLGLVKSIGVCNFTGPQLIDLLTYSKIKPALNQIELHPYLQQKHLVEFCHHNDVAVTAYSPLGSPGNVMARNDNEPILIKDPVVIEIAKQHNKSVQQVLIRFAMQRGLVVIPKSTTLAYIKSNLEVFDFELTKADMTSIAKLERKHRFVNPANWSKIAYFE